MQFKFVNQSGDKSFLFDPVRAFSKDYNLIYILLLAVLIFSIRIFTGFNGLYGQDSYEYLRYADVLTEFFRNGNPPGEFFWPLAYPLFGSLLSLLIKDTILSLQLISIFSFIICFVYVIKILGIFYDKIDNKLFIYGLLFFAFSPMIFRSAFLIMADMLGVLFTTAALFHIFKFKSDLLHRDFLLSIFFASASVMTRYGNFILLVIPLGLLLFIFFRNFRIISFLGAILIILFWISAHYLIHGHNSAGFISHEWLINWSPENFFLSEFNTIDGIQDYTFINLLYAFSIFYYPAFIFTGILLILFFRLKDTARFEIIILLISLFIYLLFIAGIQFQNLRFLAPSFPIALVIFYPAFQRLIGLVNKNRGYTFLFAIAVIIVQVGLIYKYSFEIVKLNKLEQQIANDINNNYSSKKIYTFYLNEALKTYCLKNQLINLYDEKNFPERKDSQKPNKHDLVLFNEYKFKEQWKGRNPILNWYYIKSNYLLKKIQTYPDNWKLYEIE